MTDNRLAGADLVRALACLTVLGHHVAQRIFPRMLDGVAAQINTYLFLGSVGVCAFFVLSGYLLSRPFWVAMDAGQPMPSLRTYFIRRGARIIPAFWLALTVAFILSFTLLGSPFDGGLVLRYLAGATFLAELHWFTWFPVDFNLPLWSIGCEVFSYVLLAFALWGLFRLPFARGWIARILWVGVIALIVGGQWLVVQYLEPEAAGRGWEYGSVGGAKLWWPNYNPVGFFAMFAVGVLAAGVQVRVAHLRSVIFDLLALGAFVGIGYLIHGYLAAYPSTDHFGLANIPYGFPWFPLAVGAILATVPSSIVLPRITETRPVAYVARVSFGVYIWHFFLMEVVRVLWQPNYMYWGMRDVTEWALWSAGIIVVSFVIATLSYKYLEEPIIRWARSLERRPTAAAPTLSPAAG